MWTDEECDDLRRLWTEGRYAVDIGNILKKSKNSIIGKAHRLGLEPRRDAPVPGRPKKDKKKRISPPRLVNYKPPLVKKIKAWDQWVDWPADPVPFMQLEEHHCRSVEGKDDHGLAVYCGRHRVSIKRGGETYYVSSWCSGHAQRYYAPDNS